MKVFKYTKELSRVDFEGSNINLPDSTLKRIKLGVSVNLFKQGIKPVRLNIKSDGNVSSFKDLDYNYYIGEDDNVTIGNSEYVQVVNLKLPLVKSERTNDHIQAKDDGVWKSDLGFTIVFFSSHWSRGPKAYVEKRYLKEVLLLDYSLQAKAQELKVNRAIENTHKSLKELGKTLSSYNPRKDKDLAGIFFNAIYSLDRIIGASGVKDPGLERFRKFVRDLEE